jgi:hypothetical protein
MHAVLCSIISILILYFLSEQNGQVLIISVNFGFVWYIFIALWCMVRMGWLLKGREEELKL